MTTNLDTQAHQIRCAFARIGTASARDAAINRFEAKGELETSASSPASFREAADRFEALQSKVTGAVVDPEMTYNSAQVRGIDAWSATKKGPEVEVIMKEECDLRGTYLSTGEFTKEGQVTDDFYAKLDPYTQSVKYVDECYIVGLPGQTKAVLTRTWSEPGHENLKLSVNEENFAAFSDSMGTMQRLISTS